MEMPENGIMLEIIWFSVMNNIWNESLYKTIEIWARPIKEDKKNKGKSNADVGGDETELLHMSAP
jgi:hypothetical protein